MVGLSHVSIRFFQRFYHRPCDWCISTVVNKNQALHLLDRGARRDSGEFLILFLTVYVVVVVRNIIYYYDLSCMYLDIQDCLWLWLLLLFITDIITTILLSFDMSNVYVNVMEETQHAADFAGECRLHHLQIVWQRWNIFGPANILMHVDT